MTRVPVWGRRSVRWRWPWSSRQSVTGVRVRWWAGGRVPWCSRWNSSSLCGPSGMTVRARLVLAAVSAVGVVGAGQHGRSQGVDGVGGADPAGGVGPGRDAVGGEGDRPAGSLFDPVVASAQAEQVVVAGGPVRPGPDVVEVAEHGGDVAAGEPAAPVAGPDPFRHPFRGPVPVGADPGPAAAAVDHRRDRRSSPCGSCRLSRALVSGVVEQGAGDRVAGRDLHRGAPRSCCR